jgi:hypothetical protein
MFLRISNALGALALLAACGSESPPSPGDKVDCAIGEAEALAKDCTLEKVAGTQDFVVHHPDGGFRRFTRDPATGGIATFDGAENIATAAADGGALQVQVGADRYRIPPDMIAPPTP